ncbi:MAG: hypothetical protein XD60_1449 [Acetothermia bacterium 64_32]|nr:MAG: hypothetical protein XD60_1449 [Acetothermia bacterium 64_32]HAF71359.1 hypothetical protein [Candidatus Acetothermia bacterium]
MTIQGFIDVREKLSVILDEIDADFRRAAVIAKAAGLKAVELRMAFGRNIVELQDSQLKEIKEYLESLDLKVCVLATPLLKCFLPGEEDKGKVGDQFGFPVNDYMTHKALVGRVVEIASFFETKAVRCFSFWATGPLDEVKLHRIADLVAPVAEEAKKAGKTLLLENEPSCFVKTAKEASRLLSLINNDTPMVHFLWDPGNGKLEGEDEEEALAEAGHLVKHVHLKDFVVQDSKLKFVPPGRGTVDYETVLAGLREMGYEGFLSFEPCTGAWDEASFAQMVKEFIRLEKLAGGRGTS